MPTLRCAIQPRSGSPPRSRPPDGASWPRSRAHRSSRARRGAAADQPAGGAAVPPTSRPADPRTSRPADQRDDDIDAEREEDEAEDLLRAEEAAAAPGAAMFTDLDGDIAAEAEADRFVADDFLLGAAGAASGVPEPPSVDTLRAGNIGIDPAIDPRIALEDDEVTVDDARRRTSRRAIGCTRRRRTPARRPPLTRRRSDTHRQSRKKWRRHARPGRWRCW